MSYVGNTNTTQAFTPAIDYFSGNGSTVAFTLSRPVASVAQVQVVVNNVAQNPTDAYTVLNNTITFTGAPSIGTNNIYVYYTSPITQVIQPGQGTVTSNSFGVITDFTTTGNTVLGNASTDTLNVGNGGFVKDASGNVGIGTSFPTQKLSVAGTVLATGTFDPSSSTWTGAAFRANGSFGGAYALVDGSAGYAMWASASGADLSIGQGSISGGLTQRLYINGSGTVMVGTNTAGLNTSNYGWQMSRDNESFVTMNTPAAILTFNRNNDGDIFKFFRNGSQRGWVSVQTTGTTFGNLSDRREKQNFAPAPSALDKLNQAQVQSFDWKAGGHTEYGFVAQDLYTVFPFVVTVGDDGEQVEKPWGLDNSKLVPVLVKAIQEQQAIITALNARVEALENK
jgi:hypothetical protein